MVTITRRTFGTGVTAAAASLSMPLAAPADAVSGDAYLVGAGLYDITGAVAETGAFGYAANQAMTGLHARLYAHAFIIGASGSGSRLVFVSVDLGAVFQSIKLAVIERLRRRFGSVYPDENVMLSATHTHVGNSGHSHDRLYQIAGNDGAGYGYDEHNYDAVVTGIVEAIARAHANLEPGHVSLKTGTLTARRATGPCPPTRRTRTPRRSARPSTRRSCSSS